LVLEQLDVLTDEVRGLRAEVRALRQERTRKPALDPAKLWLSPREAARLLGVDRKRTLRRLIADGVLRAVKANRGLRIPRTEVVRLIETGIPEPGKRAPPPRSSKPKRLPPLEELLAQMRETKVE